MSAKPGRVGESASRMPIRRIALAAALAVAGLFWWLADRAPQPRGGGIVSVRATAGPAGPPGTAPASGAGAFERQILDAIGEPGTRLRNVRIVDQGRQIACGERVGPRTAAARRFVWLSQLRQLVTDDGGQNFAILVHVCSPPPPS